MTSNRILRVLVLISLFLMASVAFAKPRAVRHRSNGVAGRYMVLLDESLPAGDYDRIVHSLSESYHFTTVVYWREVPRGFICEGLAAADADRLSQDSRVKIVEQDARSSGETGTSAVESATWNGWYLWHLDRLDETTWGARDGTYEECPDAASVYAYIIDNGVQDTHQQLTEGWWSRVVESWSFADNPNSADPTYDLTHGCTSVSPPPTQNYFQWHGTAVASMIAGTNNGASRARIISLRVYPCGGGGLTSATINAVRWIHSATDQHTRAQGLVNLSGYMAGWLDDSVVLDDNIRQLVLNRGRMPFFTAADNFSGDACAFSPARLAYTNVDHSGVVFTMGGTMIQSGDNNDYRWQTYVNGSMKLGPESGSNGGRCVSAYGPAGSIFIAQTPSPGMPSNATYNYGFASGTSFSSPLAAGIAARYMEQTGISDYAVVYNQLLAWANATAVPVNVNTPESWFCFNNPPGEAQYWTSNPPAQCIPPYYGIPNGDGTSRPYHFLATFNESQARVLYSGMSCF